MKRERRIASRVGGVVVSAILAFGLGAYPCLALAEDGHELLLGEPIALEETNASAQEHVQQSDEEQLLDAQATTVQSGLTTQQKPTLSELRRFYASIPDYPTGNALWSVLPNVSAYNAGTLSSAALSYATKYLAMIRYAANLGSVSFNSTLNASAAEGGLILARLDEFTHYPETPSGVSDAKAEPGKYACKNSNLSCSYEYSDVLGTALQGQADDADEYNMDRLGHRRWLLHPNTTTMGIGSAKSDSGWAYTAVRVMGDGVGKNDNVDYDYVAWPPSGAFLSELFAVGVPWSVTLNPQKYSDPSLSSVTVTVSRQSDGRSWTLNSTDNNVTTTGEYFNVDNDGYGVSNCIVFNPGSANLGASAYEGRYHVRVAGLKTAGGASTTLEYDVDFGSATADIATVAQIEDIPDQVYTGSAVCPTVVVREGGQVLVEGVDYTVAYQNNVNVGTASVVVTGLGAYSGSITKNFNIMAVDLSKDGWVDLPGGAKGYVRNKKLVTGWFPIDDSMYWFHEDGTMARGWTDIEVDGKVMHYYFNPASGNLVRNTWFQIEGKTYYFRPSGNMATGFATISDNGVDKKYYLDGDGQLLTGWQDIEVNGNVMHYYFRPSGSMATGWATIDGQKYWFRPSGNMATGWADVDDAYKRYFDGQGHMLTGWQQIGGKTYYFRASGAMQTGTATIDGVEYTFSDKGVLVSGTMPAQGEEAVSAVEAQGEGA